MLALVYSPSIQADESYLSGDCYFGRIAVEQMDIVLDPLQSHVLIENSSVHDTLSINFIRSKEAKGAEL